MQYCHRSLRFLAVTSGAFLFLLAAAACGGSSSGSALFDIAVVQSEDLIADRDLLAEIAQDFYAVHSDQYDFLVLWGAPEFAPGNSYYQPVKNDVSGIGYGHLEFFDDGGEFGSDRLQGIIWMGPDWLANSEPSGPASVLGILAQETAHRWGATIYFHDEEEKDGTSGELLGSAYHWNFFLDTGASPLGGNQWEEVGGDLFRAVPVDNVTFSQLDLYLMGLLPAEEVEPLLLLVNIRDDAGRPDTRFKAFSERTASPITVRADVKEIPIESIIAAEGLREPSSGFTAENIRQAWIYVSAEGSGPTAAEIDRLKEFQSAWSGLFSDGTGGRGTLDTSLFE